MRIKKLLLILSLMSCSLAYSATDETKAATPAKEAPAAPVSQPGTSEPQEPAHETAPENPVLREAPPHLPSSKEMTSSYESSFVKMIVTLLGIIFLVFATFWILKRVGKGRFKFSSSGRGIAILERKPLSPKTMLYIVEMGNKKILISESQVEVRALNAIEEIEEQNED